MGILDFVPLKELPKFKSYDDTPGILNCEICGCEFLGQKWMLKSKKQITCSRCWSDQKLRIEDGVNESRDNDDIF